jgi:hypothetical protein
VDIFFQDPSEIPLPPDEVRIRVLRAEPLPDGRRVRIYLEVDPFQKRPSAEVDISDSQGMLVSSTSVIESMARKMEFVMHLRQAQPGGTYTVSAVLFYSDPIPEPRQPGEGGVPEAPALSEPISLPETRTVDQAETTFSVDVS